MKLKYFSLIPAFCLFTSASCGGNEPTAQEPEPEVPANPERPDVPETPDGPDTPSETPVKTTLDYGELYAFPGAEGHGRHATGGRGGVVYHVTNLEDDTNGNIEGSLRWALKKNGPKRLYSMWRAPFI